MVFWLLTTTKEEKARRLATFNIFSRKSGILCLGVQFLYTRYLSKKTQKPRPTSGLLLYTIQKSSTYYGIVCTTLYIITFLAPYLWGMLDFSNRKIDELIISGVWHIDQTFGIEVLNQYLHDLMLRGSGFSVNEIGLSERRKANAGLVYAADSTPINDSKLIYNAQLTPANSIAVLKLSGAMRVNDGLSSSGVESLVRDFRAAYQNPNISSIILEINSGGGEATAGAMMKNVIQERNKPVISYAWMAGSAAYLAASATDEIIAATEGAQFGSIGVLFSLDKKFLEYYTENNMDIYASKSPDKNAAFRAAQEGDFSKYVQMADQHAAVFQKEVQSMRPLKGSESKIQSTLNGAMFFAEDAKSRGLVDNIGNFNLALLRAQRWAKKKRM